jgi:hypothetical protein
MAPMKSQTIQIEITVTPEVIKAYEWNNYGFEGKPLEALAIIFKNELMKDIESTVEGYRIYGKK